MEGNDEDQSPEERLRRANELTKLKLTAERGARFSENPGGPDPALENEWLHYIQNFEEQYAQAKKIKLFDRIGKPEFVSADDLNILNVEQELSRLLEIMSKSGVVLDILAEYEDLMPVYRFITEELFEYEMDDIRVSGMFTHFCYEDFHPNHAYDLRNATDHFLSNILERPGSEFLKIFMSDKVDTGSSSNLSREAFTEKIREMQASWGPLQLGKRDILSIDYDLEKSEAFVRVDLHFASSAAHIPQAFTGIALIGFCYEYSSWQVCKVEFPGLL